MTPDPGHERSATAIMVVTVERASSALPAMRPGTAPRDDPVLLIAPQGALDSEVARGLRELLAGHYGSIIIDLSDCIIIDPRVALRSIASRHRRGDACIVCRRVSGRRLIQAFVGEHPAVFPRVADALDAFASAADASEFAWTAAS